MERNEKLNSMTLEDAIKHCYESIDRMKGDGTCEECIAEHQRLAKWLEEINDGFELRTTTITSIYIGKKGIRASTNNFTGSLDVNDIISNTRMLYKTPHMILVQELFFNAYDLKERAQRWIENHGWEHQEGYEN